MKYAIGILSAALVALAGCGTSRHDEAHGAAEVVPEHAGHGTAALDPHAGHTPDAAGAASSPVGYAVVPIDSARLGGMALATTKVEERDFTKALRTVGVITLDETRSSHVHPKVRGWIDSISVSFVGRKVAAGEGLCSIYSQDVFAAELEFVALLDRSADGSIPTGEFADGEKRAQQQIVEAARRRLALWDVPKAEVARLESTRQPRRTFTLTAPRPGVVIAKQAIVGMFVDPSLELYTLSDLSRVWVLADVYERDVPYVHIGDHAQLTIEGQDAAIHAKVAFLPPTLDEATRTMKMRFELDNKAGSLRPGAFVIITLDLPLGKGLAVPESAVIRTGTRAIVFVVRGDRAEPREITLGPLVGDQYRIDAGLDSGDLVATGAQFLLDSESRLQASSAPKGGHVH
ncbi:MAG: efflux RND transporter periplasmic adaptor subunit [Byssovorax sp.]